MLIESPYKMTVNCVCLPKILDETSFLYAVIAEWPQIDVSQIDTGCFIMPA
jgi:hypothetical protein